MFRKTSNRKQITAEIEGIIQDVGGSHKDEIRSRVYTKLIREQHCNRYSVKDDKKDLKTLLEIKNNPDIMVIDTDKTKKLAIIKTENYKEMMMDCIRKMNCKMLNKDPTATIQRKVRDLVNKHKWPDECKGIVKINKFAQPPRIIGKYKDHKQIPSLRPIVSKCNSPTYYLEKALVPILKELLPPSNLSVKCSSQFIEELQKLEIKPNYRMASFDVVNLYPSVNVKKVFECVCKKIEETVKYSIEEKATLITALKLIISNNYFIFDSIIYKQITGAPMGSPISGLLAEFELRELENNIFDTMDRVPVFWRRYVDDIFVIWPYSIQQMNDFLKAINEINTNIQFTTENESTQGTLNFLDINIRRYNTYTITNVYRKPGASQLTISAQEPVPMKYKLANFRFLIKRAFTHSSTLQHLDNEIDYIYRIAYNNGFPRKTINKLINKIMTPDSNRTVNQPKDLTRRTITYYQGLHESLFRIFKKYNIELIAKSPEKLNSIINRKMDPTPFDMKSGVYAIPYFLNGNVGSYIGMTTRPIKERISEHINDIKRNLAKTAVAKLALTEPADIQFRNTKIIYNSRERWPALVYESLEIVLGNNNICNDTTSFNLPNVWRRYIENTANDE